MPFEPVNLQDLDQVQQHHDALMEIGRLELMAEEIRHNCPADTQSELLSPIEQHMRELDQVLVTLKA